MRGEESGDTLELSVSVTNRMRHRLATLVCCLVEYGTPALRITVNCNETKTYKLTSARVASSGIA